MRIAPVATAVLLAAVLSDTLSGALYAQKATTRAAPALAGTAPTPGGLPNMPALPPVLATSPRDSLLFADRMVVGTAEEDYPYAIGQVTPTQAILPAQLTGTGFTERVYYHQPSGFAGASGPLPLVVAYHGFGASAASVGNQTTIDEHCEARGWYYLSVTGLDDKLFGTPVAQRHVDAAIQWMLDTFDIDPDRIYMVGFSMGGGVVTNYAARHRDPDGIMIAAVATVSGAFDWTTTWNIDPSVQAWMVNSYNFGASPDADPFAYQRSSALHFDPATYPPLPGVHLPDLAMATNLGSTPLYSTWDLGDTLPHLPAQSATLVALVSSLGGQVQSRQVTGTVDPSSGQPATHSWAVLDPFELFDFFAGKVVERSPAQLSVQADHDGRVGWIDVVQASPGSFTWFDATRVPGPPAIWGVRGAAELRVDLDAVAPGQWPLRLAGTSADGAGFRLGASSQLTAPGWFVDAITKQLILGQAWDPSVPAVGAPVAAFGSLDVRAWPAAWTGQLSISPNPVALGQLFTIDTAVPAGPDQVWLVIHLEEAFFWAPNGHRMLVSPFPPAIILPLMLSPDGTVSWPLTMPADPVLAGLRLLLQGATITTPQGVSGTTNPFSLLVE